MKNPRDTRLSRRQAIGLLGAGAGLSFLSAPRASDLLAAPLPQAAAGGARPAFPKGAIIRTILKDLEPDSMPVGDILFHEHLDGVYDRTQTRQLTLPPVFMGDIGPVIEDVKSAAKDGVVCIVDGGHADMGRNLDHLKQISSATGVHVVASGGWYMQKQYPAEISTQSENQVFENLVKEANQSRFGAFGEIGQSNNLPDFTADERKVFRAIGRAQVQTNLPIFTHSPYVTGPMVPREAGLKQLDVFESVGVKPERVCIGHACCLDEPSADIIKQIARRGAFVGFDRVGYEAGGQLSDAKRVTEILAFLDAGYVDHLLLSSDTRQNYSKTERTFLPLLRAAGVNNETIRRILYDNPRRFLAFVPRA